ncbi:hypothetical protein niasHS_014075 [Heterodera schachtii]|uniref:SET domain-containing protein n=1 Tax=Heterodera schachtii TaxID=97005 RepID=A0ABD2IUC2_HETSC
MAQLFSVADLSAGKEAGALRAMNEYNFEQLLPFEYIASSEPTKGLKFEPPTDHFLRLARPKVSGFEVFYSGPTKKWALRTTQWKSIAEDAVLFEYAGELSEDRDEPVEQDDYIFTFDYQKRHFLLDACRRGNLARFVNHSCVPNCFTRLALVEDNNNGGGADTAKDNMPRLFICASRRILAGEEITLDYGDAWWHAKWTTNAGICCQCKWEKCRYKTPI